MSRYLKRWRTALAVLAFLLLALIVILGPYLAASIGSKNSQTAQDIKAIVQSIKQIQTDNRTTLTQIHQAVNSEIPGLEAEIARDKATIAADDNVINQESSYIIKLALILEAHHISPGAIQIKPPPGSSTP